MQPRPREDFDKSQMSLPLPMVSSPRWACEVYSYARNCSSRVPSRNLPRAVRVASQSVSGLTRCHTPDATFRVLHIAMTTRDQVVRTCVT
jgi:hypothetical protein